MTEQQSAVLQPSAESRDSITTTPNTNYWRQLGLMTSPFEGEAEPYFDVDKHQAYFDQLDNFRQSSHALLLVPCIVGSGKTSILQQYMATQHEILGLHYLKARANYTLPQLIQQVFLQQAGATQLSSDFRQINFQLTEYTRAQGAQLLIVDDAQRLSKDTLGQLLQFLVQLDLKQCGFRVVLSGEPQLEDRVNTLCDTLELDLLASTLNIEAYTLIETRDYLQHRLMHAGYNGKLPFNKAMVKHIHSLSGGYPGRINRVAQQVLVDCLKNNDIQLVGGESLFERLNQHKVKVFSVLLLSVFFWALWQGKKQGQLNWFAKSQPRVITAPVSRPLPNVPHFNEAKRDTSSETARQLAIALSQRKRLSREVEIQTHQQVAKSAQHQTQLDVQTREIAHPIAVRKIRDEYRPGAVVSVIPAIPLNATPLNAAALAKFAKSEKSKLLTVAIAKLARKPIKTTQAKVKPATKVAKIKSATVTPKKLPVAVKSKRTASAPKVKKSPIAKKSSAATKVVAAKTQDTIIEAPKFSLRQHRKDAKSMHQRIDKILSASSIPALAICERHYMKAEGFTLQLMGAHDVQRLAEFVEHTHMHNNMLVFHSTFDGQPWYVLTYGRFDSAEQAHAAVRRLPTTVQAQHPWVRSAHSIQKIIQQL